MAPSGPAATESGYCISTALAAAIKKTKSTTPALNVAFMKSLSKQSFVAREVPHLPPERGPRLSARLVLPQVFPLPRCLRILFVGPIRVTAHPLKRQWLDRLAGNHIQVVVFVPAYIVQ